MRNMVKLGFIIAAIFFISCSNDFPPAPEMKFCKLEKMCESVHVFSKSDCETVGGEIVDTCDETVDDEN